MSFISSETLRLLLTDFDAREEELRKIITERLEMNPPPAQADCIVGTYFFVFRSQTLDAAVKEIAYHATSGIKNPPPGSLLEQCTATAAGLEAFDASRRVGLLHMAFPLKMLLQPDGHVTSVDILHTIAGAIIFDVYENLDARLVAVQIPETVIRTFPGPAHGPEGLRRLTGFAREQPAFGSILKPTAGITPEQVGELVNQVAASPLFMFVKEDENLYPRLDYSPVKERTRRAVDAIKRNQDKRGGRGLIFAPHITGAPGEILESAHEAVAAGATALMFSETFAGGVVRMVREALKKAPVPPSIYGHNAGIGVKTRAIWREVIDLFARLDGIDFRQTAPIKPGPPFLKPYGQEWEASERILNAPLTGIKSTMIVRAGALDQGNIGLNLQDAERRNLMGNILFLAGSAINSIKNDRGLVDPLYGAEAMMQAIEVHRSDELKDVAADQHLSELRKIAQRRNFAALRDALAQRYGGVA